MDATIKQMEFIRSIEKTLGIKFGGSSKGDASKFISENIEKYQIRKSLQADGPPTNRQRDMLDTIEFYTGLQFTGKTKLQATEFIQKHMAELQKKRALQHALDEAEFESGYRGECI